jgi:ligand-binding sensor domain-containing protein
MRAFVAAALAALVVSGCSDAPRDAAAPAATAGASSSFRVLESFEVGPTVYVRALAVDAANDALWVGTSLGAHRIDLRSYEARGTFTRANGLANEYVFTTLSDSRGDTWLGTNGGGLSRYRDGEWKTYFPMHGLADYWVYALAEGADGALWVGTWAGANRLDVDGERFDTYYEELVNEWVYGVAVDSRRRVWFGTEGGVSMFDGERWMEWTHQDGLGAPNHAALPPSTNTGLGTRSRHDLSVMVEGGASYNPDYVFCIHVAADDSVWAGTWGGGVSRFDGERWHNLGVRDGLAGDIVFAIAEGEDGAMWFGTDRGLSRYDGGRWQNFGLADGLHGLSVYALAVAPDGEVWAGTRGGVARIGQAGP